MNDVSFQTLAGAGDEAEQAATALAEGLAHLSHGRYHEAAPALTQARDHGTGATRIAAHNAIEDHQLPGAFGQWMGLPCQVAPADDIYRFFENHPLSSNPLRDYLADGWRTLCELMLLMEACGQPLSHSRRFLEFASGHGRFTRHLVKALGPARVVVSDVVPDAVAFSCATFGVEGFDSQVDPAAVRWPERYDTVFVLSLFSHLPDRLWGGWLARLYEAVAPGGLLVFSTHGEAAADMQGATLDAQGFFFAAASESQAIDVADYGTAFSSEAFVRRQIAALLPGAEIVAFSPRHFWHHQDAFALRRPLA